MPSSKAFWVTADYNTFIYKDPTTNSHLQFCSKIFFSENLPNSKPKHSIYTCPKGLQIILEHYIRGGLTQQGTRHILRKDLNINVTIEINLASQLIEITSKC